MLCSSKRRDSVASQQSVVGAIVIVVSWVSALNPDSVFLICTVGSLPAAFFARAHAFVPPSQVARFFLILSTEQSGGGGLAGAGSHCATAYCSEFAKEPLLSAPALAALFSAEAALPTESLVLSPPPRLRRAPLTRAPITRAPSRIRSNTR